MKEILIIYQRCPVNLTSMINQNAIVLENYILSTLIFE